MDKRFLYIIIGIVVFCLIIMLIKGCPGKHSAACKLQLDCSVDKQVIPANGSLEYEDNTADAVSWNWNFGDNKTSITKSGEHKFEASGDYTIKLTVTVKGNCSHDTTFHVKVLPPALSVKIDIAGSPQVFYVGREYQFKSNVEGAIKWKWKFMDTGDIDDTTQNPKYTFKYDGPHTITLRVSNSNQEGEGTLLVNVKSNKLTGGGVGPVSNKKLEEMLRGIIGIGNNPGGTSEFKSKYNEIKNNFCETDNGTVKAIAKGKEIPYTLYQYCKGLEYTGKRKINEVVREPKSGCIKEIIVTEE